MSFVRRWENRVFGGLRDPRAESVTGGEVRVWDVGTLRGHKYCLLTSYRRDGRAVSTPVWFGSDSDRVYIRSGGSDGKVKRIRRNSRVLIAPCTFRGRPVGAPMEGRARVLGHGEEGRAETVLTRQYGFGRRLYKLLRRRLDVAYLEVGPLG